jgi:hypothetical protein
MGIGSRIVAERFRNPCHTHPIKTSIIAGLGNIEAAYSLVWIAIQKKNPWPTAPIGKGD